MLIMASAAPLQAQSTEPPREAIVVTGSRLNLETLSGVEPLVTIDRAQVEDYNYSHFADALDDFPGFLGSVTPDGPQSQFGQGVNFLNAYGLGSNRTLTLVNGKRFVSSNAPTVFSGATPGTQVDLNAIPSILVDRVERLAIGGAPAYGSDAIAATVNVIVRRRIEGLEASALSGVTEQGDNFRWRIGAAGGRSFADGRGNVTLAASFDRVAAVASSARAAYRANISSAPNPCTAYKPGVCSAFGTLAQLGPAGRTPIGDGRVNPEIGFNNALDDGNPASILIRDFALAAVTPGGVLSSGAGAYALRFGPDGSLVPYNKGTLYSAPLSGPLAAASIASGGDGLTLMDKTALTTRLQRFNAAAFVTFDLSDRLQFYADGTYYRGTADEPVDLPSFNAVMFQGVSGALTFRTDNPFLTDQARGQLAALGYGQTFQLSRANTDLADRSGSSRNDLLRVVTGLKGKTSLAGRDWDFELSVNYGRSSFTDFGQDILRQNFVNAVNVARVDGKVVCSLTPTVSGLPAGVVPVADPACVPLNLFGEGAPSAAALDYVLANTRAESRLEQFVASASIAGSPFSLFGKPVAASLGFYHRRESARFTPDSVLRGGLGRAVPIEAVSGAYNLEEIYGEVAVPLIAPEDGSMFSKLLAFARVRHVDSSASGAFTAWSAGGSFAPIADVELRGTFTRSFRSPAILELYLPRAPMSASVPDLCSAANIGAGPVPGVRRANCMTFLQRYPEATPLIAATASVPALTGGNPGLRNETADSFALGVTVRPRFLPGLTFTADYLDIAIRNPIANLSVSEIAQACFDNPRFDPADPANGNRFCSLIRRDPRGQVMADSLSPAVTTGYVNGNRIDFSAVQASLDYRTTLSAIGARGAVSLGADLFHLRRRVVDVTGIAPARSDGLVGDPRWRAQVRLAYANEMWGLSGRVNYTGRQAIARDNRGQAPNDIREIDSFSPFATVDSSAFIAVSDTARLTVSVTNLFNRIGETYHGVIVPLSIDDALGRRFSMAMKLDF